MKIAGKHFDTYLRLRKGAEEYQADKVKAASIGGKLHTPNREVTSRLYAAMGLGNIKGPKKLAVLCIKEIGGYELGRKYTITVEPGARITQPYPYQFRNWYELLLHFKRFKTLK